MKKILIFDILNNLIVHDENKEMPVYICKAWVDNEGYHESIICKEFDEYFNNNKETINNYYFKFISVYNNCIKIFIKEK